MPLYDPRNSQTPYAPYASGSDNKPYVDGPGSGLGYDSGTLFPDMRLSSVADAQAAAKIANQAFRQGILYAQRRMQEAMGMVKS